MWIDSEYKKVILVMYAVQENISKREIALSLPMLRLCRVVLFIQQKDFGMQNTVLIHICVLVLFQGKLSVKDFALSFEEQLIPLILQGI